MRSGTLNHRLLQIVLSVPGVLGIFLPFVFNISPLDVVIGYGLDSANLYLVLPTLMAIVVLGWHLQQFVLAGARQTEQTILAVLALAACTLPAVVMSYQFLFQEHYVPLDLRETIGFGSSFIATAVGLWFFVKYTQRWGISADRLEMLLHFSPIPTYTFWLIGFFEKFPFGWDPGAYSILLATCCYLLMIGVKMSGRSAPAIQCVQS